MATSSDSRLSPQQQKLVGELEGRGDVNIEYLYRRVFGEPDPEMKVWRMQQKLGSLIVKVNDRLGRKAIAPGRIKQTYTLAD